MYNNTMISLINYHLMKKRINQINLPIFKETQSQRWAIIFIGKVKRVAFRNEALLMAKKLNLVGFVKNNDAGVYLEVEGPVDQLQYFLSHIFSIKRFIIKKHHIEVMPLKKDKRFIKR